MSNIRPLTELKRHWPDCGQADRGSRFHTFSGLKLGFENPFRRHRVIEQAVETEIIPRLLTAHGGVARKLAADCSQSSELRLCEVEQFVQVLVAQQIDSARSFVKALAAKNASLDFVFIELFSPAVRHLHELWKSDACDFADVTIALSKLQQLLNEFGLDFSECETGIAVRGRKAFLAVMPGDQHTFGNSMLQEFFRRSGWEVSGGTFDSIDDLVASAGYERVDVVGLSVSCDVSVSDLRSIIYSLRQSASKPVKVMVGGRFFVENPELVARVGADATAGDGRTAVSGFQPCLA